MKEQKTEILIVGAGPAGLSAARAAADQGGRVLLVDNNPQVGGQIWRAGPNAHLPPQALQCRRALGAPNVDVLTGARVVRVAGEHTLLLETADDGCFVTFNRLILCTGARERLLPFPGWTLPGVTGAGALQALIKGGYGVRGNRVVISGSGPLLLAAAHSAKLAGAELVAIAEQAPLSALARFAGQLWRWPTKLKQGIALAGRHYRWGVHVVEAMGENRLEAVRLRDTGGRERIVACDRLACGHGLVPNEELAVLLGCATTDGAIQVDDRQATTRPDVYAAGECTGVGGCELSMAEGRVAGLRASNAVVDEASLAERRRWRAFADALAETFVLDGALRDLVQPDTFICRCEDVTHGALKAESGWGQAKLETRCGMGACQGRICGPAAEWLYGWERTSLRLPAYPTRIDTLAACADGETGVPAGRDV